MSERVSAPPPPPPHNPTALNVHDPVSSQSPPVFESGTYVVQVPKDQIYRIPPPENARFIQLQNPEQKKRSRCPCLSCCSCCVLISLIFVIFIALAVGLSLGLSNNKKTLDARVQHFVVKNFSPHHEFDLKLKIENPDVESAISDKKGGTASLFHRERKLADGKLQNFHRSNDNLTEIVTVLKGPKRSLPEKIRHSIKNANMKLHVSFSSNTNVQKRSRKGDREFFITCNFMVDTLSAGTRILTQKCHTNQ